MLDLVRESAVAAEQRGQALVAAEDVEHAIRQKIWRANLIEERVAGVIAEGTLLIATEGEAIGVMILTGFLAGRYARERPLALSASIAFEQHYEEIEGDSASSAELYALLSSLSGIPLAQSIAVTGSVNQQGEIQPVGGINEKIEGFFDVCRTRGLTGHHGVVIPEANARHLMLKEEVVQAVRDERFHIRAVATVDEGLEILCGRPAGARAPDGTFAAGTVNAAVEQALVRNIERLRQLRTEPTRSDLASAG